MKFDIITIFPQIFDGFLEESLIKRAQEKGLIEIRVHNLRKWAVDKHKSVDDKPFGGGRGMVFKVEPIFKAVSSLTQQKTKGKNQKIILFTPRGKKFNQRIAYQFSKLDHLIMICGRYEGIDERVVKYVADVNLSIGNYILMGGEVPAMVVIEAVTRLIPGVLGKSELLLERMAKRKGGGQAFVEYPQYTRPAVFELPDGRKWKVPEVLLSGNHQKIQEWRKKHSKII
jgi:tRNA (guanine37-N1)-methyltransferase